MSPTVMRYRGYRFFFFSREEKRKHVHITSSSGEAKFWIEPDIDMATSSGFTSTELNELKDIIEKYENEIREVWDKHFGY
jgi:hypothetical protein